MPPPFPHFSRLKNIQRIQLCESVSVAQKEASKAERTRVHLNFTFLWFSHVESDFPPSYCCRLCRVWKTIFSTCHTRSRILFFSTSVNTQKVLSFCLQILGTLSVSLCIVDSLFAQPHHLSSTSHLIFHGSTLHPTAAHMCDVQKFYLPFSRAPAC